jgi:signal transduction histidine kinase
VSPTRLLHTSSFRLAALYAALFAVSACLLFGIVYWIASDSLRVQARLSVESAFTAMEAKYRTGGIEGLAAEISQRVQPGRYTSNGYLLLDSSGRKLAGNMPVVDAFEGWRNLPRSDAADETGETASGAGEFSVLAYGGHLAGGGFLAIGTDMRRVTEAEEDMIRAFAWAMGAALLLALAGGIALSRGFLRRIDNINRTTRAIMAGKLGDRIRTGATGDELDQLAANLNEMLDRLQHLMEGMRQVSNDIAHEVRTPLSRLKQRLDTARSEARTVADYESAIDQALQDTDAALGTFGALLRIAQIESGTRRAHFAEVALSEVLQTLAMTYSAVAEDLGKRLATTIAPDIHVFGDRELLTQMFVNLIENGLRHTPEGATVSIALEPGEHGPMAVISDDGRGIPERDRDKVFDRFYRLETSRNTPGSGLGLALVAAVAELHHARIRLADNNPGLRVILEF